MSTYEYNRSPIPASEPVRDNHEIMDRVSVLYTPGHTKGHASVVVHLDDTIVMVRKNSGALIRTTILIMLPKRVLKKYWRLLTTSYQATAHFLKMKISPCNAVLSPVTGS
jgi:hypothetical protein